jgi:AbrB family looped-hinge helix DNA binding protein
MEAVKLGRSRQVVIPKKIHDALGLAPGDYLEVELRENRVVFTPKTLVDKIVEHHLNEAFADIRAGRVHGPFKTAEAAARSLKSGRKAARK